MRLPGPSTARSVAEARIPRALREWSRTLPPEHLEALSTGCTTEQIVGDLGLVEAVRTQLDTASAELRQATRRLSIFDRQRRVGENPEADAAAAAISTAGAGARHLAGVMLRAARRAPTAVIERDRAGLQTISDPIRARLVEQIRPALRAGAHVLAPLLAELGAAPHHRELRSAIEQARLDLRVASEGVSREAADLLGQAADLLVPDDVRAAHSTLAELDGLEREEPCVIDDIDH